MENLDIFNRCREVPKEAQKAIGGGKLRGMTDINPMWRIQKLTEEFGPVGKGWRPEIVDMWFADGANGEIVSFVKINLYVKYGDEWSVPIPGIGGSGFINTEKGKLVTSDECYKMAYTDALSVSCKALGIGADIYWEKGKDSKYQQIKEDEPRKEKAPIKEKEYLCIECGIPFKGLTSQKDGKYYNAGQVSHIKKGICDACKKKQEAE